jgi:uncharacterized protein (TIGR03067 family)
MIRKTLVIVAMGLLVAADAKDKEAKDEDKLKGTWVLESEEQDGSKQAAKDPPIKVTFTADGKGKAENGPGGPLDLTYELDATKKPKHIRITAEGIDMKGIYKIDGDALTLCLVKGDSGDRPNDFVTNSGDGRTLVVLKREKK